MSAGRLTAELEAGAIVRKVSAQGDFATVLRRGDSERGAILLVVSSRGSHVACLQRRLNFADGSYSWAQLGPSRAGSSAEIGQFLEAQARFDPDLWQIELDIAEPERFIAETTGSG